MINKCCSLPYNSYMSDKESIPLPLMQNQLRTLYTLDGEFASVCESTQKIFIYGTGRLAVLNALCLLSDNIYISAFIDEEHKNTNAKIYNKPIVGLNDVEKESVIVIATRNYENTENSLKKQGYHNLWFNSIAYMVDGDCVLTK